MERIIERSLENLRGKYIKQTLTNIETQGTISNDCRKAILDGYNEYHRELLKVLEEILNVAEIKPYQENTRNPITKEIT